MGTKTALTVHRIMAALVFICAWALVPTTPALAGHYHSPPDLVLAGSDQGMPAVPGGMLVYALAYSNDSPTQASGVTITETVPAYTVFNASASPDLWSCADGSPAGTVCTLSVGTLSPGNQRSVHFGVRVALGAANVAQINDSASIGDDDQKGPDPTPENNRALVASRVYAPVLVIAQQSTPPANGQGTSGQLVTYTVSVTNIGVYTATNVLLSDALPSGTVYVTDSASTAPTAYNSLMLWAYPALGMGETWTFSFSVQVLPAGAGQPLTNNVSVTYGQTIVNVTGKPPVTLTRHRIFTPVIKG